jgi:hypothetical protein
MKYETETKKQTDIVFDICERLLRHSPEASYIRLNSALRSTLENCILADLPFKRDTFTKVYLELRGSWWFGDGAGSSIGEYFYTLACNVNHASAQQSFEAFAERPAVLWEEQSGTPSRLHVGCKFTWKGRQVTVTSMRKDSLVACSYKGYRSGVSGMKVGAVIGYAPEYVITSAKRAGQSIVLSVVKAKPSEGERDVATRLTIPYAEIVELRRSAKVRVKTVVNKIAACNPTKDAAKLTKEINASHFRHFELEQIQKAFQSRKEWLADTQKVEAWRKGENGAWLDVKGVILRVRADRVECSNGNSVSRATAAAVLPVLLARRNTPAALALPLDSYQVNHVNREGVKIGCTRVPWSEIDLITSALI